MPCQCGETITLNGHCRTPGCPNVLPSRSVYEVAKPKPRTKLRRMSSKKRKELKETKPIREVAAGERCEICNGTKGVSTHEIPAGSHRHRAVYDRRCQMRLCQSCHECLQGLPYDSQIAFKIDAMIAGINEAHGSVAVTTESVKESL